MESDPNITGAIFFGVFRGKISEGISLKDDYCRCVVTVGIPFGSMTDPRVILKKEHLNNMESAAGTYRPMGQMPAGKKWYQRDALQAVNQALGRVVRHQDDYGILVLADSRYG